MADPDLERRRAFFDSDFIPWHDRTNMPTPEVRIATALEFVAYRLGRIDNKLDRLVAVLEYRPTTKPDA